MSDHKHAIETELRGYVALSHAPTSDQVGVGMYAGRDPDNIRRHSPSSAVTNIQRARSILRKYHDWILPSEDALLDKHLTTSD